MKYLFLDTNIYLHFIDFEQIPWSTLVGDDVTIVVPMTVIAEIDKIKDGQSSKVKNKAKRICSKFASIFIDENTNQKFQVIQINEPSSELLIQHNLSFDVNDDKIIGAILTYPHKQDSIVVSCDNTMLIKAKLNNIKYLRLSDDYLLKEEKTKAEIERDDYKKQLQELQNRNPDLHLCFANEKNTMVLKKPSSIDLEEQVAAKIDELRLKYPILHRVLKQKNEVQQPIPLESLLRNKTIEALDLQIAKQITTFDPLCMYSNEHLENYNAKIEAFYSESETFYRNELIRQSIEQRIFKLEFCIINTGTAMSGEMLINISIPNDVKIYNNTSGKYIYTKKPVAPSIAIPLLDLSAFNPVRPKEWEWNLESQISSDKFTTRKSNIIHGTKCKLEIPDGIYIDLDQTKTFIIYWAIADSESANGFTGELHVIINNENIN